MAEGCLIVSLVSLCQGLGDEDVQDGISQELQPLVARRGAVPPGRMRAGLFEQVPVLEGVPQQLFQLPAQSQATDDIPECLRMRNWRASANILQRLRALSLSV